MKRNLVIVFAGLVIVTLGTWIYREQFLLSNDEIIDNIPSFTEKLLSESSEEILLLNELGEKVLYYLSEKNFEALSLYISRDGLSFYLIQM